jgi:flagellar protein FliO/FliZ
MDAVLRVVIALVLVVGAMWVLAKVAKRPLRKRAANSLDVLARAQLSRNASVAVVRVDKTALVVGVTDGGISLLHQVEAETFTIAEAPSRTAVDLDQLTTVKARPEAGPTERRVALAGSALSPATWRQAMETLRERTARGS